MAQIYFPMYRDVILHGTRLRDCKVVASKMKRKHVPNAHVRTTQVS